MPGETPFTKAKFALAGDKVQKFPAEVSKPGTETLDKYLQEHTLTLKSYAGPATLKSGELATQGKSGETFTLPAVGTANQIIGIVNATSGGSCKVTTSGGATIYGDFIINQATITLAGYQHVILQSDGGNWLIIAGEPKRESGYTEANTARVSNTEYEPSVTRPALVTLSYKVLGGGAEKFKNGGLQITANGVTWRDTLMGNGVISVERVIPGIWLPPGTKWKALLEENAESLKSTYQLL